MYISIKGILSKLFQYYKNACEALPEGGNIFVTTEKMKIELKLTSKIMELVLVTLT